MIATAGLAVVVLLLNTVELATFLDGVVGIEWSSGLVDFLKRNSQGLVILILLALMYEFAGVQPASREELRALDAARRFEQSVLTKAEPHFLVSLGLSRIMGDEAANAFGHSLMLDKPTMRDASVSVEVLTSNERPGETTLRHRVDFTWDQDRILLVALRHQRDVPLAIQHLAEVTEIRVQLGGAEAFAALREAPSWPGTSPFNRHDGKRWLPLELKRVGVSRTRRLCASAGLVENDAVFFEATTKEPSRIQLINEQYQVRDERWTWWQADRLMELVSLTIDVTAVNNTDAVLQTFWSASDSAPAQPYEGRWEYRAPMWLAPSDGFCVYW